jgi:hypothetical protein
MQCNRCRVYDCVECFFRSLVDHDDPVFSQESGVDVLQRGYDVLQLRLFVPGSEYFLTIGTLPPN